MRLSRFALAGLVVIFGLAAWILLRGESGSSAQPPEADGAITRAPGDPAPGAAGAASADADALARADADVAAAASDLASASDITGPRLIVKVIDLIKGTPVAGATIWVFDPSQYDEKVFGEALKTQPDWELLAPAFASKLSTDEKGFVVVAQPSDWLRLLGRSGALYGEHYQETGPDGQIAKMLLETDGTLRVRVTDQQDQGLAGVPIGLRTQQGQQSEWLAERTSGADGRAVFAHVQRMGFRRGGNAQLELAPAFPLDNPPVIPLRLNALPATEQILVLPATGSVVVRLLDPDRRPLAVAARVYLQKALAERPEWMEENDFAPWAAQGAHQVEAEQGVARFERVGLGLALEVGADFDGTYNFELTRARGPERAGEEVVIEAVQKVLRPSLLLRILRPDGSPLTNADIRLTMRTSNAEWSNAQSKFEETDDEGWLRATLDGEWVQERTDAQRSLEVSHELPDSALELAGRLPGRAAWQPGPNELGELRLEPVAILAAGHVVDEAGQPIVGANVVLSRRLMRRGRESWRDDTSMLSRSGPDGNFSLSGFLPEGVYRLSARHADYKPEVLPWRELATDHRMVMKRGRFLQGRVLLAPELAANNLEMRVVTAGTAVGDVNAEAQARLDRYGQFSCGPGVSERVDLWIWDRQTDQVLYRVEALAAHDPGADPDPRLDPLDLRDRLYEVEVIVRSEVDDELNNGINFALSRDTELPEDWSGTNEKSFKVLVADEGWKLWVQAQGHKRQMVDLVGRKVELTLLAGPRVLLRLADAGVRTVADQMWINLRKEVPTDDEEDQSWHDLKIEGSPMSVTLPGFYRLTLYFRSPNGEGDWNWVQYPPEGFPIEIRDLHGVQEILLPWTEAEVRAQIPPPAGN
jgi:hypothetical protein